MDEQNTMNPIEDQMTAEAGQEDYARLAEENRVLTAELTGLRADLKRMTEREQGERLLEKLVGSRAEPLFERALQRAQSEDLAPLSVEKRYELGYLLCLGEQARAHRPAVQSGSYPPPFAPSAGNGQVALSALKAPTSFEMAKENAKKYFKH